MRDLSLHLMDIIQNSISAGASEITVSAYADINNDMLTLSVEDNGSGMDVEVLKHVTDPFSTTRTTRKVGLGIPLLKASATRAEGDVDIISEKGKGTLITATFKSSHIDRLPLGDIAETMAGVIMAEPDIRWKLVLKAGKDEFLFDSYEIKEQLGDVPVTRYDVITWIREYIGEEVKKIFGGVLYEVNS
jgi:anti-sigma regulatory factor (Ser/Thr protein kinase)